MSDANRRSSLFNRIANELYDVEQVHSLIEAQARRARPELEEEFVAPHSETERRLASLWAQVLGLEEVGIHDNFFKLGGSSIQGAQLLARVYEVFAVEIELAALFDGPGTVAALAEAIELIEISQADSTRLAQALQELGEMTDEEAKRQLADPQAIMPETK